MNVWQAETGLEAAPEDGRGPEKTRLYNEIAVRLGDAIADGRIANGTVLLEGPLASQFGCSRAPVRQALKLLEKNAIVSRFDGRGYVVGAPGTVADRNTAPIPLENDVRADRALFGWQTLYEDVEKRVVFHSFFGRYRINENEMARHYKVGRTVARDVLIRLEQLGIVEKDEQLRWSIVPLDDVRIRNLYQLRGLIEPEAIAEAAVTMDKAEVGLMLARLKETLASYPDVSTGRLYELEVDLHVRAVGACDNCEMLSALKRTHAVLTLSKHVLGFQVKIPATEPFLGEHIGILEAVLAGDADRARQRMRAHIGNSMPTVTARAAEARISQKPVPCGYIIEGK
jgi:DNA-binding GntR family transcriptional regulator